MKVVPESSYILRSRDDKHDLCVLLFEQQRPEDERWQEVGRVWKASKMTSGLSYEKRDQWCSGDDICSKAENTHFTLGWHFEHPQARNQAYFAHHPFWMAQREVFEVFEQTEGANTSSGAEKRKENMSGDVCHFVRRYGQPEARNQTYVDRNPFWVSPKCRHI